MPSFEAEIDAHFYELIHRLLHCDQTDEGPVDLDRPLKGFERRVHIRKPFASTHKIASYDGLTLPQAADFTDIQCHDLARGGFSYLSALRPESNSIIAAFGIPPHVTCTEAQVVRVTEVLRFPSTGLLERIDDTNDPVDYRGPNGEIGIPLILLGCQFVRRLRDDEAISWE
jgi:hypothetical protein